MMQSMKGATRILGSMNRSMNLPALQRIATEFERENEIMDQRQEMMDEAVDDAMGVDDEAEGDEVVEQVLEEIGIDLKAAVCFALADVVRTGTDNVHSWERHRPGCRRRPSPNAGLRRLLEVAAVVVLQTQTMTCRQDSTV
jgi:charged multivesicular body protein 2A